jgi:hypothetical protein
MIAGRTERNGDAVMRRRGEEKANDKCAMRNAK